MVALPLGCNKVLPQLTIFLSPGLLSAGNSTSHYWVCSSLFKWDHTFVQAPNFCNLLSTCFLNSLCQNHKMNLKCTSWHTITKWMVLLHFCLKQNLSKLALHTTNSLSPSNLLCFHSFHFQEEHKTLHYLQKNCPLAIKCYHSRVKIVWL